MRAVIADDSALARFGVSTLLAEGGHDVVGEAANADDLLRLVDDVRPDAALIDIRMPPSHTDEGIQAAHRIRADHPSIAVLVLSQYVESSYAVRLLQSSPTNTGYLLKETVTDAATLNDALARAAAGEGIVDPAIVTRLLRRARRPDPLACLSARERDVLTLMAEGRSNASICALLTLSPRTVETHVTHVFQKLGLVEDSESHRRVLAVLAYLRDGSG